MNSFSTSIHRPNDDERIDTRDEYARCVWARYFNTSEKQLREAVQAVGDRAGPVRAHLQRKPSSERPSSS
jgi:hypothetical protein